MPPVQLPSPHYLRYALVTLALAVFVLLGLPYLLHVFDAGAGGFTTDKLNTLALAATLFWGVLQLGFLAYRALFRRFKGYQSECLEESGKLFENVTEELEKRLAKLDETPFNTVQHFELQVEMRKTAQFKFIVRCVRLSFCLVTLFALLQLAQHALTVAMLATPGAALSSLPL